MYTPCEVKASAHAHHTGVPRVTLHPKLVWNRDLSPIPSV